MRQCQCGGVQREHELTNGRTAYTCNECGRYQALLPRSRDPGAGSALSNGATLATGERKEVTP